MAQRDFINMGQAIGYRVLGQPSLANMSLASRCPDPNARFNFSGQTEVCPDRRVSRSTPTDDCMLPIMAGSGS